MPTPSDDTTPGSRRLSSRVSEQPGRLDQQHHGRDQIEHGQLDLGKELNSRGAHEAHDQRADERPLQAAEAPDDDDDEGEYERVEAHPEHRRLARHDDGAAEARHEAADRKKVVARIDPPREPDEGQRIHHRIRGQGQSAPQQAYEVLEEQQQAERGQKLIFPEEVIRLLWGGLPLSADPVMDALPIVRIAGLIYPAYNLFVIGIGVVAALLLWVGIYRTKFGVMLRATSQDRRMASALGINVGLVYVSAFAIGCFMAGLGGAIIVPSQAAVLGMGFDALILAFIVVVIGGLGSLQGALVGALIVSFVRTAGIQFFPEIELAVLYLIAAVVLLVKPTGLFGDA